MGVATPLVGQLGAAGRPRARVGRLSHVVAWVAPPAAAAVSAVHQGLNDGEGDANIFVWAGRTLLSGQWSHAFSHAVVQAGPLQLALFGSLGRSSDALALVLAPATALLVVAAVRAAGVTSPILYGGAGLLAVATGLTDVGYVAGHPADAVLPLIWILAAADARRGHSYRAGLLVGLCAGLETWGILGVAVLAFAPRRREAAIGAVVAGATAAALFLPFLLGGHFHMFSLQWQVRPPAPISLVVASGTAYGWPLRLAQGAFAVGAGVLVARLLRDSPHGIWAAPLATVCARLLLDPLLLTYYFAALKGPLFVGAAVVASSVWLNRGVEPNSRAPAAAVGASR
jgi:hypothetical protein